MMQAMVLVGVLAICAVSGALLTLRPRWTPGPDEPTGAHAKPAPPAPNPPPATAAPSSPLPAVTPSPQAATAAPGSPPATAAPDSPLVTAAPGFSPAAAVAPVPVRPVASPVRRGRNSGFHRFAPAGPAPVGRITPRVHR